MRQRSFFLLLLSTFISLAAVGQTQREQWFANKYSMFIHFGLYSQLGGVWQGEPVTRGYSEQIQSFAGIFSDWYGETARSFDPVKFNADSIVALAQRAGMRSIVLTTKHHDGFCMWGTATTRYNSVDATPRHRDYVGEMAEACRRAKMNFGLYFSLIDWHFPQAYPISSHNCDFITPQHHELTKQQVTELLTRYGNISELWFDMGSNTPAQSHELYQLVHKLQPHCMVSGRVGNDQYDFCVMADNTYPAGSLHTPWQSAASMFDETWSYRSWQKRGQVSDKVNEKIRQLINVVAHGGNFLLNIGPRGDGSVVEFEAEVLETMGNWLHRNGDAIYGTSASPYPNDFAWGAVTCKADSLYLILSGEKPTGDIELPLAHNRLLGANVPAKVQKGVVKFALPQGAYEGDIQVIRARLERPIAAQPANEERTSLYSYSCFDYYSNYRSTIAYSRNMKRPTRQIELEYTPQEVGKTVLLSQGSHQQQVKLQPTATRTLKLHPQTRMGALEMCGPAGSLFDAADTLHADYCLKRSRQDKWTALPNDSGTIESDILQTYFVKQIIESPVEQTMLVEVGAGNGVEVYLNGHSVMKHLNPYRTTFRKETVKLALRQGSNEVIVRLYNRFEEQVPYLLRPAANQVLHKQTIRLEQPQSGLLTMRQAGLPTPHSDTELYNVDFR